jgi:hypothetical protein
MGRNRFVTPEIVRIPLSDGDWIEVKKRLSVGESRQATTSFIGRFHGDGSRTPNPEMLGMGWILAYLVRWSFRDGNDLPVGVSLDALKALDLDTYAEIEKAIEAHEERVATEDQDREKKVPAPIDPAASATS